jgi:hypothetical protein
VKIYRVSKRLVPERRFKPSKWQVIIEEFVNDEDPSPIWLIPEPDDEYASKRSMYTTAIAAVKRFGYDVEVHMIKGEVHMFKN